MRTASESGPTPESKRRAYHHGNLRDALIDIAIELIGRDGLSEFSIAEAGRRLNVSTGAPYRHFADRDELVTAIAIRGCEELADQISRAVGERTDPVERLAHAARGYVQFAVQHPALFEVLYTKEVFLVGNPNLVESVRPVVDAFVMPAYEIPGLTAEQASTLILSSAAVAHGYGSFLKAGTFKDVPDAVETAGEQVVRATRALVMGSAALIGAPDESGIALAGLPFQVWVDAISQPMGTANAP